MRPPFTELIIKLVVLAIVLIPIGWAWWRRRQSRDENGRFSMMSDARNPGQPIASADRFEKVIGGSTFQCETHDGDADIPPYLVVTLEKEFNGDFSVTSVPNGEEPGWLKRHGITHVLSGDESFDVRFNVVTDRSPAFATECFHMPEMRDAVRDLFDKGHALIRNDGLGIDTAWTHLPDDEDRESAIEWTASRVQVLADCCTAAAETQKRSILPEKLPWGWMLVFPITLPFLAIAASAWLPPQNHGQHIDELAAYLPLEILFVAVFAIPWLLVTCSVVKGRGNSLTAFIALLIFSLAGFFGASFPLILLANTTLDQGPPTEHNQWVVDIVSTESGLRADVLSWRPEKQIQQVRISEDVLAKDRLAFADCKMLTIETKPGFLGHEWISSVKPFSIDKPPQD